MSRQTRQTPNRANKFKSKPAKFGFPIQPSKPRKPSGTSTMVSNSRCLFSLIGVASAVVCLIVIGHSFIPGMSDMFHEILKFGAMIVDALVEYKQPVFVYLPPQAELRGGAWVVLDTKINSDVIEMYADPTSRGGVLEPEGIVEIKFRKPQLQELMHRLDKQCIALKSAPESAETRTALGQREDELMPVYRQVAVEFADLHDTPGRMLAKNAIRGIVAWKDSRRFFYWRLRLRLEEFACRTSLSPSLNDLISISDARQILQQLFGEKNATDRDIVAWLDAGGRDAVKTYADDLARQRRREQFQALVEEDPELLVEMLKSYRNES
jgi:acetyl-CoA carboxylase/biotin carboxylase 1